MTHNKQTSPLILLAISAVILLILTNQSEVSYPLFDQERAYRDIEHQLSLGPRIPGSEAHLQTSSWIHDELSSSGWVSELQETEYQGKKITNVIGKYGDGYPWLIIGAHYDTRIFADEDSDIANQKLPVPGANDGASGVAVLLELSRILPVYVDNTVNQSLKYNQVWLVFFDAEDNGKIPGWDWILGSRAFLEELDGKPDAVVIVDMIGDADLNIYLEKNSDVSLMEEIWDTAGDLGYGGEFINHWKYRIIDDHVPFREAGIPAVDIIDFDYPYWHTVSDTIDKVSSRSLKIVGDTLLTWVTQSAR
jgi:Zn-dependent M28 family amino/carboxypeptidase